MNIGKKIYYGKSNGIVIWDKGEMSGSVRETTLEEDKAVMPLLQMVDANELGICQLEYGAYATEFATCKAYKINTATGLPEFLF